MKLMGYWIVYDAFVCVCVGDWWVWSDEFCCEMGYE